MFKEYFLLRKRKKMIRQSASFILKEFAIMVFELVTEFEKEKKFISLQQKEVFKFEVTALIFWLFLRSTVFSENLHKLLLDEIHEQYFMQLKKSGYDFDMRQIISNDLNQRYQVYNNSLKIDNDYSKIGIAFANFLSEKIDNQISVDSLAVPILLTNKLSTKFNEWKEWLK